MKTQIRNGNILDENGKPIPHREYIRRVNKIPNFYALAERCEREKYSPESTAAMEAAFEAIA